MHVRDFGETVEVRDEAGLRTVLSRRFGEGFNEFECFHEDQYPLLTVWVNRTLACVAYWSDPDSMELYSRGEGVLPPDGVTEVRMGSPDNIDERPNEYVVGVESALAAVSEFMDTKQLPKTIAWVRL